MRYKRQKNRYRIFIFANIGGYFYGLKKGFEKLGMEAFFYDCGQNPYDHATTRKNEGLARRLEAIAASPLPPFSLTSLIQARRFVLFFVIKICWLVKLLLKYDIFIFGGRKSIFSFHELPLLKLLGKRIIYIFLGTDSRPFYISGRTISKEFGISMEDAIRLTGEQKRDLRRIERYADFVVSHPPSSHLHEKKIIKALSVGIPAYIDRHAKSDLLQRSQDENKIRILHAPTATEPKGTKHFRRIMEKMRSMGFPIDFIELTKKPNEEVIGELARCDFVLDEMYSDSAMGRLAAEAALFAKPTIVGGYASFYDMGKAEAQSPWPCEHCHPDRIDIAVQKLISDRDYRVRLGLKAKDFVEVEWAPEKVAGRYLRLINNDFPAQWLYNPKDIRYSHGWGLSEDEAKALLRRYIEEGGRAALMLQDKPELEEMLVDFAISS